MAEVVENALLTLEEQLSLSGLLSGRIEATWRGSMLGTASYVLAGGPLRDTKSKSLTLPATPRAVKLAR